MYADVILNAYDAYLAEQQADQGQDMQRNSFSTSSRPSTAGTDTPSLDRPAKLRHDSSLSIRTPSTPGGAGTPTAVRPMAERALP